MDIGFGGAALTTAIHPGYVSGNSYLPLGYTALTNGVVGANTLRLRPFILPQAITINALTANVVTAASGGNVQAAIYNSSATTKQPTTVAISTPSGSTTTAGAVSMPLGAAGTLQPGLYYFTTNTDSATATFTAPSSTRLYDLAGSAAPLFNQVGSLSFAQTFGSWSDLTGQTFGGAGTAVGGVVGFTVA